MTANDHPLARLSADRPKLRPPVGDQTPVVFPSGFLPSIKQRIKDAIGYRFYPLMNRVRRSSAESALRTAGVDLDSYPTPTAMSMGQKGFGSDLFLGEIAPLVRPVSTVVAFGCGLGYEAILIARRLRPQRIIGYDFFDYRRAWDWVTEYVKPWGTDCEFIAADLREPLSPAHEPADLILSFSVLEHLRDMERSFEIMRPLVKPYGWFASLWGPMWASFTGDHIAAELGEEFGFEHLRLDPEAYLNFYKTHPRNREDVAKGVPTWLELGLHNFARYDEYESAIAKAFGRVCYRRWQLSEEAFRYRTRFPQRWNEILARHQSLRPLDLILQGCSVVARFD